MKATKKIILAMTAFLFLGVSVFAQEIDEEEESQVGLEEDVTSEENTASEEEVPEMGFNFSNVLSSNVVDINKVVDDDDDNPFDLIDTINFAGVAEAVYFDFYSEKIDAGVNLKFMLANPSYVLGVNSKGTDAKYFSLGWVTFDPSDFNYYLEFRPFKFITLAYHDNVYMDGSLLPICKKNIEGGNLGSKGFSVIVHPISGLRIAASVPFDPVGKYINNVINDDKENPYLGVYTPFTFGAGVDYTYKDLFSIGVEVQDIINSEGITISGYGMVSPTKDRNLTLRAGFTHTERKGGAAITRIDNRKNSLALVRGKDMFNFSVEFYPDNLSLAAEVLCNLDPKFSLYDIYVGYLFGYKFTDSIRMEVTHKFLFDLDKEVKKGNDSVIDICPKFIYTYNRHEFSVGADLEFLGVNMFFNFPIAWKYTL